MKKNSKYLLFLTLTVFLPTTTKAAGNLQYTLLENFPGFFKAGEAAPNLPSLITSLYSFGIWIVGIAAMFMMVIGGVQYIISAGNKATAESGKRIISDALLGLVAALASWLFLYVINPDLTKINLSLVTVGTSSVSKSAGNGAPDNTPSTLSPEEKMQPDGSYPVAKDKSLPKGCAAFKAEFDAAAAATGVSACEIEALASVETGCVKDKQNKNTNGTIDCGIMQINKNKFSAGKDCAYYKANVAESLKLGAQIYKGNYKGSGRSFAGGNDAFKANQIVRDKYAAYNGGSGAIQASNDCLGKKNQYGFNFLRYDCTINQGGYVNTARATTKFLNYYTLCTKNSTIYKN
jgi:hypothetical protein